MSVHPMVLVNAAFTAESESRFDAAAREYWAPSRRWNCLEFLCERFEVVELMEWPDSASVAGAAYSFGEDLRLAKQLLAEGV